MVLAPGVGGIRRTSNDVVPFKNVGLVRSSLDEWGWRLLKVHVLTRESLVCTSGRHDVGNRS